MEFVTKYQKERVRSNAGSRMQPQYKMTVNKETGAHELKQKGEINLYAQIQSFKNSTDVNYILEKFARGDESALSKVQGVYGDFTEMPKTLAELSQRVLDARTLFDNLPLDVREQFDFNPSVFFASIGSDKFNAIFADKNSTPQPVVPDPVKVQEQQVTVTKGEPVNE